MKRLERKCLIASAFTHGLLLVLVFVGPAFVTQKTPPPLPPFELFDMSAILVDDPNVLSGGNPAVTTPPPVPVQAPPPVQQAKAPEPVKPPERKPELPVKPPEPESPDLSKAVPKTPPPKPEKTPSAFDFSKAEKRTITPPKEARDSSNDQDKARETQLAQSRAGAVSEALKRVQGGLSTAGSYEIPGPGGPAYASYYLALRKFYENAWIPPNTGRGDEPVVEVEVVIARDGAILSQRILKQSGRRELDNSIQNTLNRVEKAKAPPFPAGSKDEKRTFRINFNLTEKLSLG